MDVVAAFCVGWSETLVGFPFVTAKVLVQNGESWRQRPLRYYQGVKYPLMGSVAFNMLVFPMHERLFPYLGHWGAGFVSGLAVSPQVFMLDTFTIRRQTNQAAGSLRGARGFGMTLTRESLAMATYFGVYHRVREGANSFVAGGCAGLANWTLTYPLDTIRTRQIAQGVRARDALGHLWKGYRFAAARSVVVNAVSFSVYERAVAFLKYTS
jgi:hypothetical protein